jgi:hypothetical protein
MSKRVFEDRTVWVDENGQYHREGDLPAVMLDNGGRQWWMHGKVHRDGDKPAVEQANGTRVWYINDVVHREALDEQGAPLPSIIDDRWKWAKWVRNGVFSNPGHDWVAKLADGTKGYYRNSELHFDNGVIHILTEGIFTDRIIRPVEDEKTQVEELKCGVCLDNKRCIAFNCGHFCTCNACSQELDTCPVCRVKIITKTRIYL